MRFSFCLKQALSQALNNSAADRPKFLSSARSARRDRSLADDSRAGDGKVFPLRCQVDILVTDAPLPDSMREVCEKEEVEVIMP